MRGRDVRARSQMGLFGKGHGVPSRKVLSPDERPTRKTQTPCSGPPGKGLLTRPARTKTGI